MSLCKCARFCEDTRMIGQDKKGPLRDSHAGVTESHQELYTSALQNYCDLKQAYLLSYLINPFQNKIVVAQA